MGWALFANGSDRSFVGSSGEGFSKAVGICASGCREVSLLEFPCAFTLDHFGEELNVIATAEAGMISVHQLQMLKVPGDMVTYHLSATCEAKTRSELPFKAGGVSRTTFIKEPLDANLSNFFLKKKAKEKKQLPRHGAGSQGSRPRRRCAMI